MPQRFTTCCCQRSSIVPQRSTELAPLSSASNSGRRKKGLLSEYTLKSFLVCRTLSIARPKNRDAIQPWGQALSARYKTSRRFISIALRVVI